MNCLATSLITLACLSVGLLLGVWLQYLLPDHHLSKESQETIKLGTGVVATMSALVLGLLVTSAKSSFDAMNVAIAQDGARIIQLDHLLGEYGPETRAIREYLRMSTAERVKKVWSKSASGGNGLSAVEKSTSVLDVQSRLRALTPQNDLQKSALNQSLQISTEIWQSRLLVIEQQQEPLPQVFLVLLVFWLTILFLSFGLFAPGNATVFGVMLVCALSVSSAVFLILELGHPLDGVIKASNAPLIKALEMIGH